MKHPIYLSNSSLSKEKQRLDKRSKSPWSIKILTTSKRIKKTSIVMTQPTPFQTLRNLLIKVLRQEPILMS